MKAALLVIDLQRYFLEVGHAEKLALVGPLIANTSELIDCFHSMGLPVVKVHTVHKADGSTWNQAMKPHWTGEVLKGTLTEGTWEAESHPDLPRHENDLVVNKTRGSAFLRTDLENVLRERNVDTVVVAGFSTNRCVGLTAIEAWERDFKVILAGDAILGTTLADGQLMLNYLGKAFAIKPMSNAEIKKLVGNESNAHSGPEFP